jgi:hypothetical protein
MTQDYLAELKKQPYKMFVAPKPYSFELNEDMIELLRKEFNADKVSSALAEALKGKPKTNLKKAGDAFFKDMGAKWMKKTIQMGEEYSDRTIDIIHETVNRKGVQFLIFPLVYQRFVEIAYLSTQEFLKLPVTLNSKDEFSYRVPRCALYGKIMEKCGEDTAKLMTCKNYCTTALETVQKHIGLDVLLDMPSATAKDGFCEFSIKKL